MGVLMNPILKKKYAIVLKSNGYVSAAVAIMAGIKWNLHLQSILILLRRSIERML